MLSILINAYACSPNMGSEPGMAWNWCTNLAKYCELHIITEGEFRDKIEAVLPTLPQGKNMHFHYNPVSDEIRKMCWNQGDWRFYKYYKEWQWKTYEIAKEIMQQSDIFFFTSVAEGTPHVVLEAIGNNLPVVCFDTCGQGDSVNEQVGMKIPLSTPKQSAKDFAEKINYLYHHRDVLQQLSKQCSQRQEELSWDNKAKQMVTLYSSILTNSK
jgi:glycosyltransferase involved in cell wall biosynthesis